MKITKYIFIALISIAVLMNCQLKVETNQAKADAFDSNNYSCYYREKTIILKNMEYYIVYMDGGIKQTGYPIFVTNLTKDSLECASLRKSLTK